MKYSTAHKNINDEMLNTSNINLAFVYIDSSLFNPIVKQYKNGIVSLVDTVKAINILLTK